ncbi:MAG: hypothetical protein AAB556_01685 [Patescibacteria group bacterium]|mgnify:CR=1 FL=1
MRTAVIVLGIFLILGILIGVGALLFNVRSFSSSLPRGAGGLIIFSAEGGSASGGDVFKTISSTAGLEAKSLLVSKINPKAMYMGTAGNGVWVSRDGGKNFKKAQDEILRERVDVYDIKEDISGNLYLSTYNGTRGSFIFSSYKTGSSEIYFNSLPRYGVFGASLEGSAISIISSDGGFYRSANNGRSWELRSRRSDGLLKMFSVSGKNFVLTSESAIISSSDSGKSWKDIAPLSGRRKLRIRDFYADPRSGFLLALADKLLLSQNGGESWRELNLIVPAGALPVISVSIHPANSDIIYASSEDILYKSTDSGSTWSLSEVPSARRVSGLFVSPVLPNLLFLATK